MELSLNVLYIENYPCEGDETSEAMARCTNLEKLILQYLDSFDQETDVISFHIMTCLFASSNFMTF